jgi:uncharacterized membrane-anchored protein
MPIRWLFVLAAILSASSPLQAKSFAELFPDKKLENDKAKEFAESLNYQQGDIALDAASAKLKVPNDFYFLSGDDARRVIVNAWGNPPGSADAVLGMILPAAKTPLDDTWGAVITYDGDGYISDADAEKSDYAEILRNMQAATEGSNEDRKSGGYPAIKLVGWASPPFYDKPNHKLHWAKEIEFDGDTHHTLNYDVRALGRHGVLNMNFVAGMEQLPEIKASIPVVMAMPEFSTGSKYTDFVPSTDKVAAYGIGALIAGKVAAKTGLLLLGLAFLKKAWILVAMAVAGGFGKLKSMVSGRKTPEA